MPLSPNPDAGAGSAESSAEPSSFEAAFRELQQVVAQLEDGGLDLERAIHLFERGSQLVQLCERIVDQAELRVTRLAAEAASPLADASVESRNDRHD
jgi:exodeoxyribonuclease VII small subunit